MSPATRPNSRAIAPGRLTMIRWGVKMLPGGIADFPNVQALHDRLAADEAVQRVLAREAGA